MKKASFTEQEFSEGFLRNSMDTSQVHFYHGYSYQINSRPVSSGEHHGIIIILAYGETKYTPSVEITTSKNFKKNTAARIEASALAYELINKHAIEVLLPGNVIVTA